MARLDAVLFDIDDTLFSTTEFAQRARRASVEAMVAAGLDADPDQVLEELGEIIGEFSSNYDRHFDQLLKRVKPEGLGGRNPAIIVAAGIVAYHDTKYRELKPFDDVLPLLEGIERAGLRRGIVTHGWTTKQAEKLVRLGLVPHLDADAIFISDQIGIAKPNPKLYLAALRQMGLPPKRVMYVGDSPQHDIAPPKSLGMVTVWSERAAKHRLEGTGIEPDHVVSDFEQLRQILRDEYAVPL
ncbi:HAD-IA family hydrolase [Engelhardtia mirabilis]